MAARPTVSVYSATQDKVVSSTALPAVFTSPIRSDIVQFVHKEMAKNGRQAYAVNRLSGMKHSAESWGTGRAVARIPRVKGSGTHAAAAGAFGNQCRNGRMFAPTKTWRRWHRRINLHQKRYAMTSALAATAVPALLLARGHKIENIAEVPLVVEDAVQAYAKTRDAVAFLTAIRASDDVNRVNDSKTLRAGKGKSRNRRFVQRRGPLLVLPDNKGVRAFRNIFGLDIGNVNALNLLTLAPGGHVGRFVIWTQAAFAQLDKIFGTFTTESAVKKGFVLPPLMLTNADVTRIMRSDEVRRALTPKKLQAKKPSRYAAPSNGMKNRRLRLRLNPFEVKRSVASKGLRNPKTVRARRQARNDRLSKAKKGVRAMVAANKVKATKKTAKK